MGRRTKKPAVEEPAVEDVSSDSNAPIISESYGNDEFEQDVRMQQSAASEAGAASEGAPPALSVDVPHSLCRGFSRCMVEPDHVVIIQVPHNTSSTHGSETS